MKNKIFIAFLSIVLLASCAELDLNPLSEGSSENWYADETEINMSLNDLYREYLWDRESNFEMDRMTDDWTQRQAVNSFVEGTITSEWSVGRDLWLNTYKGITRANTVLNNLHKVEGEISQKKYEQFAGEAYFMRAALYARLIFHFGDVPYYTEAPTIDEAFKMGRTNKEFILEKVYEDFDLAIQYLPEKYSNNDLNRATKGAGMAFKARTALYFSDWEIVRDAAKACIELGLYSLHTSFSEYFLSKTKNSNETIFALPRSFELGSSWKAKNFFTRTAGGSAVAQPSWDLLCSFLCTDGLPIDESPLYDPREPFKNRDPRCAMTIVEFGTEHLGYIYDPNPYTTKVLNVATGTLVNNKANRAVDRYAPYNGLELKKWVDEDWSDDYETDFDIIIMRYADVLLMYAEAKIELNEIDDLAIDAINQVRARAYGVKSLETGSYPAVTIASQEKLRSIIRVERRSEFGWENRRYYDLIRWRIAEKALTRPIYGLLDVTDLKKKVVDKGLWFFPETPQIDENGIPDLEPMYNAGLIKLLVERNFDKTRQYLWPIPSKEILINDNLEQNPGY
ncbi:RagB/SusD family nutrient uptake outer membrane protein [Maribellus sp. CM-23]|uniref:RagB/SusD family nutrient uptake outer membrane protein n=1 Tax=Maribellus sp. CM-23 TaxID=2781026 RepID=UPI001F1973A9|nr:RagB/SusD family nutrient uptake outer membrane protein [Maribellus sp. CM-23]MCE4564676.1 RagB/SusD family nutrient uptake outer membrane protein [Maribellus sp. CM-23]